MTIDELRETDDNLVMEILDESIGKMTKTFSQCPYPKTMECLLMLMINTNFLKVAVFDTCANDDPFSAAVLYRCIIEHYLRHFYIYLRFIEEKIDAVGLEYYELADIKEHFDYFRSANSESAIFEEEPSVAEYESYVFEKYPKYKSLKRHELNEKLSQFSVKSIIAFIWTRLKKHSMEPSIFHTLITDYSILSSYVHGGPHANRLMLFYSPNEEERQKEKEKLCRQSYFFTTHIKLNTYIAAGQYDRSFLAFVPILEKYAVMR